MSFNNHSRQKYPRLQETINIKQRTVDQLYRVAEESYQKVSEAQKDKWNSIISVVGTRKDKVSMIAAEIIKNPHTCLQKIEELIKWSFDKNNHFALDACSALVNIFDEYVFADKKNLKVFVVSVQERIKKGNKENQIQVSDLVGFYIQHHIKHFYGEFVKSLQKLLSSSISFIKKQAIKMLTSLTKNGELRRMIIASLINKLGDSDSQVVNQVYKSLKEQFHQDLQSSTIMLEEAKMLIFRHNISKKTQFYLINLLNNFNMKYLNEKGIEKLFELYYHFFEKLMSEQNEKGSVSSRLFLNSIKGLNKIFSFIKAGSKEIKEMISNKIQNVYKIVHKSSNTKAKIQLYLFLFQYHSHIHGSLTDRYYRSLYQFIKHDQVVTSSLAEVFFDLLLISIKEDQNLNRQLAFIKRILQICFSAQANFVATTLLMLNNIIQQKDALKIKLRQRQNTMADQESNQKKYDINKREPIYAGAQNVLVWQLTVFNNHYHPTVRKYAGHLLKGEKIDYQGQNPLLELSSSNFLQKLVLKKQKKSQAWMLKMKKHLKKIRSAKYESLISKNDSDFNIEQEFIKKYLKLRSDIHINYKKKQGGDIQEFADQVIENQMDRLNPKDEQIDFLNGSEGFEDEDQGLMEENEEGENQQQNSQQNQFEQNEDNQLDQGFSSNQEFEENEQIEDEDNQQSNQDMSENGSQEEKQFQEVYDQIDNESQNFNIGSKNKKISKVNREKGRSRKEKISRKWPRKIKGKKYNR